MAILVKIIRSSIRKNPRAGRTETYIQNPPDIYFKIEGTELPKLLRDDKVAMVISQTMVLSDFGSEQNSIEGYLIDHSKIKKLQKIKGIEITVNSNVQTIRHSPESEYLYKHSNPKVECNSCHNKIAVNDILSDYDYDGEDEYYYEECPVCHSLNTFPERKYETLKEALQRKISL